MKNKYCVYITLYGGNKLPPFYIGSSSIDRINKGYCGSVSSQRYKKIWRDEIFYNRHLFKVIILATFVSRKEASEKEVKLQKLLKVIDNPLYTNLGIHYNNHVLYSKKRTKEHNLKISNALKGIKRDDEFRRKISICQAKRGPVSEETKNKMSISRKGYKFSEESKLKISAARKGKNISQSGYDKMIQKRMNGQNWKIQTPYNEIFYTNNLLSWCKVNLNCDNPNSARAGMSMKSGWKGYFATRVNK